MYVNLNRHLVFYALMYVVKMYITVRNVVVLLKPDAVEYLTHIYQVYIIISNYITLRKYVNFLNILVEM